MTSYSDSDLGNRPATPDRDAWIRAWMHDDFVRDDWYPRLADRFSLGPDDAPTEAQVAAFEGERFERASADYSLAHEPQRGAARLEVEPEEPEW